MDDVTTNVTYRAAVEYIREGFALIPVHGLVDVDNHLCTCNKHPCGIDNKAAGKHPVRGGWTAGAAITAVDAYGIWEEENPDWNIGIRTGTPSGFFALDTEEDGLAELVELEREHGKLPRTRVHRTGGGGTHHLFLMPDDFDVRNNQRKLSAHIDIRGTGGMIVAPPSVSGKGDYAMVDPSPIAPAPQWLINWLRARLTDGIGINATAGPVIEDLPQYADLDEADQRRCQSYARAAIDAEARRYALAAPGSGNATLFEAACNMLEIVQSPWNLLTVSEAVTALEAARQHRTLARPGGGQDSEEFRKTFQSAQGKTVGQGRALPPDRTEGLLFDPPFAQPGSEQPSMATGDENPLTWDVASVVSDTTAVAPPMTAVEMVLARMLDRDALDNVPPPKPLIRDMLDLDSETWIIGAPGGFKSFVALDWACHVGLGLEWRGKAVHQGAVVYMAAEGAKGLPLRVKAWEAMNGHRVTGVSFLPEPIQVSNPDGWAALVGACQVLKPVLIVLDTQARITVGLEENSAKDMGMLVDGVRRLKAATGACVLVVHHTGRDGGDARGSSALDAAQDTEIRVERPTKKAERLMLTATISTDKQKDGSESDVFEVQLEVVDVGISPDDGRKLTSLAIKPADPFADPIKRPDPEHIADLLPNQADLLMALRDHADHENGATSAELLVWLKERGKVMVRSSAATALNSLVKKDLVVRSGKARFVLIEHASAEDLAAHERAPED